MNLTQVPRGWVGREGGRWQRKKGEKKKETPSPMRRASRLTQVPSRSMQDLGPGSSSLFFHPRWSAVTPERTKDGRTNDGCSSTISRSLQRLPHGPPARPRAGESLARREIDRLSRDGSLTRRRKNGRRRRVESHGIMTIKSCLSTCSCTRERDLWSPEPAAAAVCARRPRAAR